MSLVIVISIFFASNTQYVNVQLLPSDISSNTKLFSAPLFVIMILFTALGLFIGYCAEYIRSSKNRKIAKQNKSMSEKLNIEVESLKSKVNSESEEILNYLK